MSAALIDRNLERIDQGIRLLRCLPDDAYGPGLLRRRRLGAAPG